MEAGVHIVVVLFPFFRSRLFSVEYHFGRHKQPKNFDISYNEKLIFYLAKCQLNIS